MKSHPKYLWNYRNQVSIVVKGKYPYNIDRVPIELTSLDQKLEQRFSGFFMTLNKFMTT